MPPTHKRPSSPSQPSLSAKPYSHHQFIGHEVATMADGRKTPATQPFSLEQLKAATAGETPCIRLLLCPPVSPTLFLRGLGLVIFA
jgi:hypothetical protein